jgi:sodium/potassium-transporting ATPase subunit alpha
VFFCFGLATYDIIQNMVFAIGIIVANVPEGLLATVTVSLALTAQRMAGKMVLVKNLESVETLGSTSCICSDKTGTLTQNRMTASHCFTNRDTYDIGVNWQIHTKNQAKHKPDDFIVPGYEPKDAAMDELIKAIVLSTSTYFAYEPTTDDAKKLFARSRGVALADIDDLPPNDMNEMKARLRVAEKELLYVHRFCKGDASETGLVQWAQPLKDLEQWRNDYPTHTYCPTGSTNEVDCAIPFSSDIKFNCFIRNMSKDGKHLRVYLKGAPERVITRCSKILVDGKEQDLNEGYLKEVNNANDDFGKLGERVLAFAYRDLNKDDFPEGYQFDMRNWKNWGKDHKRSYAEYSSEAGTYPMHDLTLCGVVSLNDPPRPNVDLAVDKCRQAGIKVIMVTGDQPPTAAAIANKVNIIKHPQKEYNNMKARGIDDATAMKESTGIVIHGDTLSKCHNADEEKFKDDPNNPERGKFIQEWISKPEVVFARTTPSQKLLIVNACQIAGHVVAVTGDGVNDSPAIKKADIGIAMGSGSDVAKNAADMLLLDDNFTSIVNGVEEGRLIFDNLKKSIAYTLSSNIPEILPFIMFILFAVPLPLSTVLILCIDLGTDMIPAISFAYENTEADIMDRVPRNAKLDHLVNSKLISFAYLQIGVIQASAGMYTYFYVLNDFGVRPGGLFRLSGKYGAFPDDS